MSKQQGTYVVPNTDTEKTLCAIWQEILGVVRVGITDNFFALGGHSLLAIRVLTKINMIFEVQLSLKFLFLNPTVLGVAKLIESVHSNSAILENVLEDENLEEGFF